MRREPVCASDAALASCEKGRALVRVASEVSAQPAAAPVGTPAPADIVSAIIPVLQDDGAVADLHLPIRRRCTARRARSSSSTSWRASRSRLWPR